MIWSVQICHKSKDSYLRLFVYLVVDCSGTITKQVRAQTTRDWRDGERYDRDLTAEPASSTLSAERTTGDDGRDDHQCNNQQSAIKSSFLLHTAHQSCTRTMPTLRTIRSVKGPLQEAFLLRTRTRMFNQLQRPLTTKRLIYLMARTMTRKM